MESETNLKEFEGDESEEFSIHTIPSNRNSIKNDVQSTKISNKRVCGIVVNIVLGIAIIVDLIWWQQHHRRLEPASENSQNKRMNNLTLSIAINEVRPSP